MGCTKILWIYEDGLKEATESVEKWEKYKEEIGQAVLKLCLDPDYISTPNGLKSVKSHRVFNNINCVNLSDNVDSKDHRLYVWQGNCLKPFSYLNNEEVVKVEYLLSKEKKRRGYVKFSMSYVIQWIKRLI
jgi:hypothetical protein